MEKKEIYQKPEITVIEVETQRLLDMSYPKPAPEDGEWGGEFE